MGTPRAHAPLAIAAAAIVFAGCTDDHVARSVVVIDPTTDSPTHSTPVTTTGSTTSDRSGRSGARVRGLQRFADCASFLDYVQAAARDRVGPYGLEGMIGRYGPPVMMEGDVILNATGAEMAPTATVAASDGATQDSASRDLPAKILMEWSVPTSRARMCKRPASTSQTSSKPTATASSRSPIKPSRTSTSPVASHRSGRSPHHRRRLGSRAVLCRRPGAPLHQQQHMEHADS